MKKKCYGWRIFLRAIDVLYPNFASARPGQAEYLNYMETSINQLSDKYLDLLQRKSILYKLSNKKNYSWFYPTVIENCHTF